jgi:hypothetical protein
MADHIYDVPEPPARETINSTLDPGGHLANTFLNARFSPEQIGQFKSAFELRHALADEIERLMVILDALDPDPDLEMNAGDLFGDPRLDDAEGDDCDLEPSLAGGVVLVHQSQEHWAAGAASCHWFADRELDDSDFEESEQSPLG